MERAVVKNQLSHTRRGNDEAHSGKATSVGLEAMETRRLLSAAVSHGVLEIEGTPRSDTIVLTMDSPRTLRVRVGNTEQTFLKKSFGKIRILAGRGDDLVTIGNNAKPVGIAADVSGGDGSDTIVGGAGGDLIHGDAGADQVAGGDGNDTVCGDGGADDLHGGNGRDSILGGRGDDQLHDDAGRDTAYGNAGEDLVYYFNDVKQFRDKRKAEQAFTEPVIWVPAGFSVDSMTLNLCPIDLVDGSHVTGGVLKTGGSNLVMIGNVVGQWAGSGLNTSYTVIPHFNLPGGGAISSASGITKIGSQYTGGAIGINTITGGAIFIFGNNVNAANNLELVNGGFEATNAPALNAVGGTGTLTFVTGGSFNSDLSSAFPAVGQLTINGAADDDQTADLPDAPADGDVIDNIQA
jgi:Ca2+-binding RTX toxin-like protein